MESRSEQAARPLEAKNMPRSAVILAFEGLYSIVGYHATVASVAFGHQCVLYVQLVQVLPIFVTLRTQNSEPRGRWVDKTRTENRSCEQSPSPALTGTG